MDQIDELKKNNDLITKRYESIKRTNEILQERIRVLKINIQAQEKSIDLQRSINLANGDYVVNLEYKIMILERKLNKLQSDHVNEKEN